MCGAGVLPGARQVLHPGSGLGVHYVSAVDSAPFRGGSVVGLRHGKHLMALEALFMSLMAIISVCIGIGAFAVLRGLFSGQK